MICGAVCVDSVIKMAVMMDCEVIVLEDRPMYGIMQEWRGSQVICDIRRSTGQDTGKCGYVFCDLTRGTV